MADRLDFEIDVELEAGLITGMREFPDSSRRFVRRGWRR